MGYVEMNEVSQMLHLYPKRFVISTLRHPKRLYWEDKIYIYVNQIGSYSTLTSGFHANGMTFFLITSSFLLIFTYFIYP